MSAIDRAFIKAYSDHIDPTAEHSGASSDQREVDAPPSIEPQPAAAMATRKSPSRAKRSAAAAAIRAAKPAAGDAKEHQAADKPIPEPPQSISVAVARPRMVVGRRALQQLAENAVVPAPHATFAQSRAAATNRGASSDEPGSRPSGNAHSFDGASNSEPPSAIFRIDSAAAETATTRPVSAARYSVVDDSVQPVAEPASHTERRVVAPPSKERTGEPSALVAAALEVDSFFWPPACNALIDRARADLDSVAELVREQTETGSQVFAVCSIDDGDGCTTVTLCLARILAERGARVCIVDANFRRPGLAAALGIETDCGLESVLDGSVPLDDVLIESLEDQLTVLPLAETMSAESLQHAKLRQTVTFGSLCDRFDAVLVDGGTIGVSTAPRQNIVETGSASAVILVGRQRCEAAAWQRARRALEPWNVCCLGAIENRCSC